MRVPYARHRRVVSVATGVLALTGAGFVAAGVMAQDPAPPALASTETMASSRQVDPLQTVTRRSAPEKRGAPHPHSRERTEAVVPLGFSRPVSISVPSIDVGSPLVRLGLTPDRELEVPSDPAKAGWYDGSAAPGAVGPTVIAGHVTWDQEPAAFFRLGELQPGQVVRVRRADGQTAIFAVTKVEQYLKDEFPTTRVYGPVDRPELRLITCAGRYDSTSNNYDANLVAYARLIATRT